MRRRRFQQLQCRDVPMVQWSSTLPRGRTNQTAHPQIKQFWRARTRKQIRMKGFRDVTESQRVESVQCTILSLLLAGKHPQTTFVWAKVASNSHKEQPATFDLTGRSLAVTIDQSVLYCSGGGGGEYAT
jgi:hypothetical protein